ncbi:MAG: MBL fold metallo-hydrolase [Gammaproteobacteria bacterium]|nr:MBL fold metallo-hydrolase [Gammaproteobacteria bacterium]MCP5318735.1 MBL fold metallo-hydrolase [Chromatiaceae bacterium]MCP5435576.1 MBL fold metallo-hydrolase [Chromatiaceae bacterium]MCW5586357.1 MBL fold metallo-hydrolase [Chromatiales bacterium]
MRMRSWLLLLMLLAGAAYALQKAAPLRGEWNPEQIAPGVYVIHGPTELPSPSNQGFMNNPAFIVTDAGVVVIDPGSSVQVGEMVLARIGRITDKPVLAVFNTHVHGDHWLGNQAIRARYPDVPIYGHERVGPKVLAGAGAEWVQLMLRLTDNATAGTDIVKPDHPVVDGDTLSIGGLTYQVMNNDKAHTDTDIMLHVPELGLVFLGDNAGHGRILRLEGGSFSGNITALDNALATGATVFVPGHGPSGGPEVAQRYRDYLDTLYATVRQGFDDGLADFEIRPLLMPRLEPWQQWAGFDIELGRHISGAYLEAEAAAF